MLENNIKSYILKRRTLKIIILIISIFLILTIGHEIYKYYSIKHAFKEVQLKYDEIEIYSDVYLKDIIKKINGTTLENPKLDTKTLGKKELTFEYLLDNKLKVPYTISFKVVDSTPPLIMQSKTYSIYAGTTSDISKELFCGDNYDDNPKCFITGEYDPNQIGEYPLTFTGTDSSNNIAKNDFLLKVLEKPLEKKIPSVETKYTSFAEIIKKYKTKNSKIGIDVSHWQGDINFEKVKETGVEFVYIRVGRSSNKKYILDEKFIQNINGFNKVGIPVGVYIYSSARNIKDAQEDAKWLIKQIKEYQVDLELVFDWENWDDFQSFNISFHQLTELSKKFTNTVQKKGYQGMLYSSKDYLETVWEPVSFPIWLAHYTENTNYQGSFKVWQLCNNGQVPGIKNSVDINVRYQ